MQHVLYSLCTTIFRSVKFIRPPLFSLKIIEEECNTGKWSGVGMLKMLSSELQVARNRNLLPRVSLLTVQGSVR